MRVRSAAVTATSWRGMGIASFGLPGGTSPQLGGTTAPPEGTTALEPGLTPWHRSAADKRPFHEEQSGKKSTDFRDPGSNTAL